MLKTLLSQEYFNFNHRGLDFEWTYHSPFITMPACLIYKLIMHAIIQYLRQFFAKIKISYNYLDLT